MNKSDRNISVTLTDREWQVLNIVISYNVNASYLNRSEKETIKLLRNKVRQVGMPL